ncbi:MAG: hypothetical protein R3344_11115, partial [Acidobacteriota bacterium]|nr:hypothetical protein [Acidobacteriota bacterium]
DIHNVLDRNNASWRSNFRADAECSPQELSADEVAVVEEEGEVGALISGTECGIVGADATDPNNPTFIERVPIPFGLTEEVAWTLSSNGENLILYAVAFYQGLKIFEVIGDCTVEECVIEERGSIGDDDDWGASLAIWIAIVQGEVPQIIAYVASTNGLQIVDVTDPNNPVFLGRYDTNPTNIPLGENDDVPQDVVVSGGLAFVPIWIGGFIVIDVTDPANPVLFQPVIPASPGSAFFKVEVSSHDNRIYVTEGLYGVAVFIQDPSTGMVGPVPEVRFAIGEGDANCDFDGGGVSTNCWAWAIDENHELLAVTYGVFETPTLGGFNLITMPIDSVEGEELMTLRATPAPEPHQLIRPAVGGLGVGGLARLRRRRAERSASS